jgi:type IV secretory pathway VirB10-like protein
MYVMPDSRYPRSGLRVPNDGSRPSSPGASITKTLTTTLWLAGAVGMSSCGFHKAPRAFNPPSVAAKAPAPIPPAAELASPPEVAFEPAVYDFPRQTDPSVRFPDLPPPPKAPKPVANVPKPQPAPNDTPAAPALRLSQILTPEESRRNNQELDQYADSVRKNLAKLAGKNLTADQKNTAERVQTYLSQAEQAREQDLVTAVSLAKRADLLAKDLLERLP